MKKVIKRNGKEEDFDINKIQNAVLAAFKSCGYKINDLPVEISYNIYKYTTSIDESKVEDIQDRIETILMENKYYDVAKSFILYRNKHATLREASSRKIFESIINVEKNDITRDNANMNADTPAGMMMKFASETTKPFVDKYMLSDVVKDAVNNNYIYIHDKDYYLTRSLTCLQHPLDKILANGFMCGHGEARPAKRIETAAALAEVALQAIQNEMHRQHCACY